MSTDAISRATPLAATLFAKSEPTSSVVADKSFSSQLKDIVESTDAAIRGADQAGESLAKGEADIVETMLAVSRAELSLSQFLAFRNRFLEAYREVMNLQV